jgi:hypothetical protein
VTLIPRGHRYPEQQVRVLECPRDVTQIFPRPPGPIENFWPPTQLQYLGAYLAELGCKTIVLEAHYIDRDYIDDTALYYSRSLRSYSNHCQRVHFFREAFDDSEWRRILAAANNGARDEVIGRLQQSYLGFSVIRPLPGSPLGRTVLATFEVLGPPAREGFRRDFTGVRPYTVHVAGLALTIRGLAFQQQDQGVSACATTALWSAINKVAFEESLPVATPAQITEGASRYYLGEYGRWLPSEGLTIHQVCEATRAAGLAPLVIRAVSPEHDRAQLLGYAQSGFPPVLAIMSEDGLGHAVCTVGLKLGSIEPRTDPSLHFTDAATSVKGVYIHDDRLGPYAIADLQPKTVTDSRTGKSQTRTGLSIQWPDGSIPAEESILQALVIPVPLKLRLTVARMRQLGLSIADAAGQLFSTIRDRAVLNCRYYPATCYRERAPGFGLSEAGAYTLNCQVVLSRYVGVIEIGGPDGPLFDVLLDSTETIPHRAILACVKRERLSNADDSILRHMASGLETLGIL